MASDRKAALSLIKQHIKDGLFQDALLQCKELLRTNPDSFEGNVYAGKCACELNQYEEAERYYKSAHDHKPTALQPYHGLVQLYRRTGAHDKHADALRHVLANTTDKSVKYGTRIELAKALIQSNRLDEASVAIIAIEDDLHEGCVNEDAFEVPEEVSMLKADCQLALDEQEYNSRIENALATRRYIMSNNGEDKRDDDLLIQEVAATWAEEMLNRPNDAVSRMAQAASSTPHPRFTKYQIEMLKRVMATIQGEPAGSAERHDRRVAAVQMCYDIVSRGGCTNTTPYELALRLLEVEEEVSACAAGTGAGVSFSLPAGASKGIAGMGGASAAGGSVSRSISIQQAAANAVAAVSGGATAPLVASTDTHPQPHSQPPLPPPAPPTAVPVPQQQTLEASRLQLTPVATVPPLAHMSSATSQTMPSSATAAAAAPGASNLDLLLSGMPLASVGGSQADGDASTLPHTPARRSSSGVTPSGSRSGPPGRKGGPSFGPTNIDLDDIETPPSSEVPSEGGAPEDAKTEAPADDTTHVGDAGMHGPSDAVTMPNSRMLVNALRGSMVRFAVRQTSEFAEPEVIPVMGSYELRSLSRMHEGAASAALASATGAATAAGAVSGSIVPATTATDVPVADVQPRGAYTGESPLRADCQSSVGPGGSAAGLGGHVLGCIPRRNSYASSDAFGGHLSLGSVAGSDELAPPRTALPPLSALPRISREDSASMLNGTYTPSHAGTAASGTFTGHLPAAGGGSFAAGGAASFAAGRSPSRVVSMSHAPSLTSRVSESAQGSFFAGNRYVPPADEEVAAVRQVGLLEDMERFAARLVHLAPTSDVGQAHLAMALQRRAAELEQATPQLQRPRVIAALRQPLARGAPTAAGWLCLAGLYRKDGNHSEALWAARMGLQYISGRVRASGERMTQAGLALRLEAAQALLALERLDEAVDAFSLLKEWTSEGEITFPYVAGIMPTSVRQQAARGLAQVEVRKGNRHAAKKQYEKLLGKALRGFGPSEHWAHAEYAWLLYEDGLREQALHHLQAAIDVSGLGDTAVDPAEVASYHHKLGRVLWETKAKGEEGAKDAANAYEAFLHAASVDGPAQAPAFACLGHYFREKGEEMKARKCYQRALELDCLQAGAGLALCELLHESNSEDIVKGICKEMLEVEPEAVWARLRLGLHHLWLARPQEAISELQAALRMEPANAEAWEALGAAYESVGRLQAALKVYERAVELDDRRVFALTQAAAISSLTGNTDGALALLDRALAVEPGNPAVLMCQCQTHSQIAALYKSLGALTLASGSLRKAAGAAAQSARINGTLETTWKSLGDCRIAQARLPTPSQPPLQNILEASTGSSSEAAETNTRALIEAYGERKGVARSAQRAYAAAVHLNPLRPASWSDLALTQHQRVTLSAAHSAVRDTPVDTEALCGTAERVLMAALRLAPDVPGLWSALGSVETAPAKREYALRRALQLDPSDALTWLKLGRLYHAHSMQGKATACFDAARSCDPKLPAIWEAMAATEATHDPYATPCSTTATQVFGLSKHALQLRGGPEAALGFLWSALRDAEVSTWGTTRAAAHCATSAQPLNAAAYHALGLVMESSSAFSKAACVLRTALVLLKRNAEAASDGADMAETEALMKLSGRAKGAGPALIAPVKSMSVQRCLELDLARVLAKSGNYQESVQLYTNLLESSGSDSVAESTGMDAYALLAFARASAGAKHSSATGKVASDADSDGMFEPGLLKKAAAVADTLPATADVAAASVATVALSQTAPYAQVRAHAQTVDVTISQAEEGVLRAPPSTQAAVHRAVLQARLSVLTAATLRATDSDFFQAESTCRHSLLRMRMHITPSDDVPSGAATMHAEAVADTHVACAARAVRYAQFARARCAAARAVHVCPWSAVHRDVAACIAASNAKQPQHASRITAQHAAGALQQLESTLMHGGAAATAHLVGGVAGLPPAGGVTVPTRGALASAIKSARVRVLQCPRDPHAWTSLAHLLTQQAALSRTADDARSAECACMQSLHVTRTDPSPDRSNEVLAAHALVLKSVAQSVAAEGCEIAGVNASMNESAQCEAGTPEPRASTSHSRLGAPSAAACSPASPARSPPFTRGVTRVGVSGGKNASTAAAGSSTSPVDTAQIALRTAQQALQAIEGLGAVEGSEKSHMHALKGASLRQLARCHRLVGDTNAMVATLQHGKQLGDPCSSILLAKQLWSCGESSEASGMLSEASRTLADSPASVACAEWLGAVHVSQVELACMAGDLKVATSGLQACAAAGSRPAGVATALVATAACMHGSASLKHHGMSPQAQQQLSQANDLAVKSFEACDGADVITVGASAIAEISDLLGNSQSAKLAHEAADSGYQHLKDGKRRHPAYMHIERDTGQESETGGLPKVALGVTSPSPLGKGQGLEDAGMKNLSCVVVRLAGSKAAES